MESNFKCMICGKPAVKFFKITKNGKTITTQYCEDCILKINIEANSNNFISSVFDKNVNNRSFQTKCVCGTTENEIIKTGLFGCSECYKTFKNLVHDYTKENGFHVGKVLQKNNQTNLSELEQLHVDLKKAVEEERFMDADALAKKINVFRQSINKED